MCSPPQLLYNLEVCIYLADSIRKRRSLPCSINEISQVQEVKWEDRDSNYVHRDTVVVSSRLSHKLLEIESLPLALSILSFIFHTNKFTQIVR